MRGSMEPWERTRVYLFGLIQTKSSSHALQTDPPRLVTIIRIFVGIYVAMNTNAIPMQHTSFPVRPNIVPITSYNVSQNFSAHNHSFTGTSTNMVRRRSQKPFQMSLRVRARKNDITDETMLWTRERVRPRMEEMEWLIVLRPSQSHWTMILKAAGIFFVTSKTR